MDLSPATIEAITSKRLRSLALWSEDEGDEEDTYAGIVIADLEEEDAISPEEEGFFHGYLHALD